MKKIFLLCILAFASFVFSCKEKTKDLKKEVLTEGYIEYEINYISTTNSGLNKAFLPSKFTIFFKEGKLAAALKNATGLINATQIIDYPKNKSYILVKMFNKTMVYEDTDSSFFIYNDHPKIELQPTDEISLFNEYKSSKAFANFTLKDSIYRFSIWYTNDIIVPNLNRNSPYKEIEGTLLDYQLKMFNYCIQLQAKKIVFENIDDQIFRLSEDYESINKETLQDIISLLK